MKIKIDKPINVIIDGFLTKSTVLTNPSEIIRGATIQEILFVCSEWKFLKLFKSAFGNRG